MWPQCQMCGVTRRNMPPTGAIQICGAIACHRQSHTLDVARNDEGHAGQSLHAGMQGGTHRLILGPLTPSAARSTNISDANQARIAATRTRLKHVTQTTGLGPTTHLSTATLQQHQHGGGAPGEPKTLFCFQVHFIVYSWRFTYSVDIGRFGSAITQRRSTMIWVAQQSSLPIRF